MKVGDYVRTDKGLIGKYNIKKEYVTIPLWQGGSKTEEKEIKYIDDIPYNISTHTIVKSSPNIIDLIEENDLIEIEYKISTGENQKEIVQVIKNVNNELFIKTYTGHYVFIEDIEKTIDKIKGIITHEQIESMEYKVKE